MGNDGNSTDSWYLARDGKQYGPMSRADLSAAAGDGRVLPTDLVWQQGMSAWVEAGTVPGLMQATATPPPPPRPPPIPPRGAAGDPHQEQQRYAPQPLANADPAAPSRSTFDTSKAGQTAQIIYILYLVGIIVPFVSIGGIILAYVNRGTAPPWVETHYTWQIRSFWIGLVIGVIGIVSLFILVGALILLAGVIYWLFRNIKGLTALNRNEAIADPEAWF